MLNVLKNLFDDNAKTIARIQKTVKKINDLAPKVEPLDDEELLQYSMDLREKVSGGASLDSVLPEAFAICREAADRRCAPGGTWSIFSWDQKLIKERITDPDILTVISSVQKRMTDGEQPHEIFLPVSFYNKVRALNLRGTRMRPYDVQLIGGIVLHEGKIAEMKTGEGKTLSATLPVYLNSLTGEGVHVVTVNDYLARRDCNWMGSIYRFLGCSVGVIQHDMDYEERRAAYNCDITYGTNNELGFDYLRDNMVLHVEHMVQRKHVYAIVDEVDSILIDEARTPLIISGQSDEDVTIYYKVDKVIRKLMQSPDNYEFDEKEHSANLTDKGQEAAARGLNLPDLYDWGRDFDHSTASDRDHQKLQFYNDIISSINAALKAYTLYKNDRDYIVKDGQVIIVDEFTGRLMHGRRYSEGLHQAIEAKEDVKIEHESQTLATITFQNFFRMYEKLAGMTGTAKTEEPEFVKIYGLNVVVIPTNRDMVRIDQPDIIYRTEKAKFDNVVTDIVERHKKGQPVLVGTVSVEKSETLSKMLLKKGVSHNVLNAKHHEREAEIVSQAGLRGQVTIATNMAGRGTDIVLGEGVQELGGLYIIGTERHESRRIDNQLRGRSGRQGDNGESRFFISLEDDLMRLFGSDRIKGLMDRLGFNDNDPIEHPWVSKSIEGAQKKVEARNFEIRKHVLEYDDVMNRQRETIYTMRREVLEGVGLDDKVQEFLDRLTDSLLDRHCGLALEPKDWDLVSLFEEMYYVSYRIPFTLENLQGKTRDQLREMFKDHIYQIYNDKHNRLGDEVMSELQRVVLLRTIDEKWIEHLYAMDHLREGIGLRAYGQVNPVVAYSKEAFDMFDDMKDDIRKTTIRLVLILEVIQQRRTVYKSAQENRTDDQPENNAGYGNRKTKPANSPIAPSKPSAAKVGRNDPCPCGSGKKYKKCCMDIDGNS